MPSLFNVVPLIIVISSCSLLHAQVLMEENSVTQKFGSNKPFGVVPDISNSLPQKKIDLEDYSNHVKPSWSSLFSTLFNFLTGKADRDGSGTKQLLNFVVSVLDMFKQYFVQRSAQSRGAIGLGRVSSDAASAIITMVKGYIKSMSTTDESCMQRYLCEVNREVVQDAREIGYIIGKAGSSVISYLLERSRYAPYDANYNASRLGLDGDNCESLSSCNEI